MIIQGFGIVLTLVNEDDASFILSLRTDTTLSRFVNQVPNEIVKQIEWVKDYKNKEAIGKEYYYIIRDNNGNRFGTIRVYNIEGISATYGSWIVKKNAPKNIAIKADILIKDFIFNTLKIETLFIDVHKNNERVLSYNRFVKGTLVNENEEYKYFKLNKAIYSKTRPIICSFFKLNGND